MSVNRENVIWQAPDGTWSRGFYDFAYTGGEDGDYEWDVEYLDTFHWLRTGLASEQAAVDAWDGANPGSWSVYPAGPENARHIEDFEATAAAFKKAARS